MGENTAIAWCHHSFNPVVGCTKVSVGPLGACEHCYAEAWAKRAGRDIWGDKPRQRTTKSNWLQPLKWNEAAKAAGVRYRVFCASLADVFDNKWELEWRADLFDLIYQTPHLDWLLLTKRIGNATDMIEHAIRLGGGRMKSPWPWSNAWLGATIVTQDEYDRDISKLRDTSAHIRFLSVEPMMEPIQLRQPESVDWIICGGESGNNVRPMQIEWAQGLREQCASAGIAFFMKQLSGRLPEKRLEHFPPGLQVREWP